MNQVASAGLPQLPGVLVPGAIAELNSACFCFSLDRDALQRALDSELGQPGLSELVAQRCPYLFAAQSVFVPGPQLQRMAPVVDPGETSHRS